MNLNKLSELSREELNVLVEAAQKELAVQHKQFSVGQKVKIIMVDNPKHEHIVGRTARVVEECNMENMYTVQIDSANRRIQRPGLGLYLFFPHEIELLEETKFLPAEFQPTHMDTSFDVLDKFGIS